MINVENSRALVKVETGPKKIDAKTLHWYLLGAGGFNEGLEIEDRLDLTRYRELIGDLYAKSQKNPAFTQAQGELREQTRMLLGLPAFISPEAGVEVSRAIYWDMEARQFEVTDFRVGELTETTAHWPEILWQDGNIPVIDSHVHPANALPSPVDYLPLITDMGDGRRAMRGLFVVCPDVQILALATKNTPIMDFQTASDRLKDLGELYSFDQEQIIALNQERDRIDKQIEATLLTMLEEHRSKPSRELDREATVVMMTDALSLWAQKFFELCNQAYNRQQMKAARALNLKLYASFDMKNFTAFTA